MFKYVHVNHPRHLLGCRGIDTTNLAVRVGATQGSGNKLVLEVHIVGVLGSTGGLRQALETVMILTNNTGFTTSGPIVRAPFGFLFILQESHQLPPFTTETAAARMPA